VPTFELMGKLLDDVASSGNIYFVLLYSELGFKLLGIMDETSILNWRDEKSKCKISNPKIYIEQQRPTGPQQVQIVPTILPLEQVPTKQKAIWLHPKGILVLEPLGIISADGNDCSDSQELFSMYRDAITKWDAKLAHVVAPTARDIGRLSGGISLGGPIKLK